MRDLLTIGAGNCDRQNLTATATMPAVEHQRIMPKLTVNPDSPDAWELELKPGMNTLGRGEENDFPIEHSSVSAAHCVVSVLNSGVIIKDSGSIHGTFVDGKPVEESVLFPGQLIRLGEVTLRFDGKASAPGAVVAPAVDRFCKAHPKAASRYYCGACGEASCGLCVSTSMVAGRPKRFCRACGGECAALFDESAPAAPAFARLIGGAFLYPFKNDGLILLGAGTVFFLLVNFAARSLPLLGLVMTIFGTGYLISYMQRILSSSAMGEDRMPDWPDFSSWADLVAPFFQFLCTLVACFAPAILIGIFGSKDEMIMKWGHPAAIVFGCVIFPMAFTAVTMFDSLAALNPILIIPSILKIPFAYLLAVTILLVAYATGWVGDRYLGMLLPIPIVPGVVSEFLGLYLMTVEMRILGLLYWTKKDELGWFSH